VPVWYPANPAQKGLWVLDRVDDLRTTSMMPAVVEFSGPLDRDLLVMGIFLHDIGKVDELSYERAFAYTDEGQLVGHLVMGVEMLRDKVERTADLTGEPLRAELKWIGGVLGEARDLEVLHAELTEAVAGLPVVWMTSVAPGAMAATRPSSRTRASTSTSACTSTSTSASSSSSSSTSTED